MLTMKWGARRDESWRRKAVICEEATLAPISTKSINIWRNLGNIAMSASVWRGGNRYFVTVTGESDALPCPTYRPRQSFASTAYAY